MAQQADQTRRSSDLDRLPVGRLPAPGAGAVAPLRHALLVDRRDDLAIAGKQRFRSEEHTSELQSLMRMSYAVSCLKKKKYNTTHACVMYTSHSTCTDTRDYY